MEVPHFIMIYMIHIIEGNVEECPCYAGLDEQLFYNAKYEMVPDDCAFSTITGIIIQSRDTDHIDLKL